jgi:hypothetical protein
VKIDRICIPRNSIVARAARYSAWGLSGKTMGILLLLLLLGSLVGSFYLNQASQTTAAGMEIVNLTEELEYWRQENAELRRQVADQESLLRIIKRAEELGFIRPVKVEYLVVDSPPLEQPEEPIRTPSEDAWKASMDVAPPARQDWWDEVVAYLTSLATGGH